MSGYMHGVLLPWWWLALRLTLLAIVVFYFVLYIVAARRLRSRERDRSTDVMLWVVVALALIRVFARFTSLSGWTYQLVIVLPGIVAAIAIPGLMKELTKLKADTELS
jgi:asparagine N-glycosylation enzyme membrane subunit Stt3